MEMWHLAVCVCVCGGVVLVSVAGTGGGNIERNKQELGNKEICSNSSSAIIFLCDLAGSASHRHLWVFDSLIPR